MQEWPQSATRSIAAPRRPRPGDRSAGDARRWVPIDGSDPTVIRDQRPDPGAGTDRTLTAKQSSMIGSASSSNFVTMRQFGTVAFGRPRFHRVQLPFPTSATSRFALQRLADHRYGGVLPIVPPGPDRRGARLTEDIMNGYGAQRRGRF